MEKKHQWTEVDRQQDPFKVPEGYFENFTERMMASLPEVEQAPVMHRRPKAGVRKWTLRLSPVIAAAAMLACAVIYQHSFVPSPNSQGNMAKSHISESQKNGNISKAAADDAYDYLMLDNLKIYDYAMEVYE